MKKNFIIILSLFFSIINIQAQFYQPDYLGDDFEFHTFKMNEDYEGEVISTIIKRKTSNLDALAVLYIHGFNDYFFQAEMANKIDSAGYAFYAVDLRKYGRSKLSNQYPFNVRSLNEYNTDIDSAISVIRNEGYSNIILMGHSTGGLIAANFARENRKDLPMNGMILNSPFLDMNKSWLEENILIPCVSFLGRFFPNAKVPQSLSRGYAYSLLKEYHGEWSFRTDWKMIDSPALTFGCIRAIHTAQMKVKRGLDISIPVLVMHSDKSIYGDEWTEEFNTGDAVLDVNDIEKYGKRLSSNSRDVTIDNGLHDLVLSKPEGREEVYVTIFEFLDQFGSKKMMSPEFPY